MATKSKTFDYNGSSVTLTIDEHTGSDGAPDGNVLAARWYNTLTVSIDHDADLTQVFEKVPDASIVSKAAEQEQLAKNYIDAAATLATDLAAAGFE